MAQNFTTKFTYDVFLSFRGEDTRHSFTGNLNRALDERGIKTFFDDEELRRGDELSPSLSTAIEESRMFVIVLSENYASSTWCLDELAKILQCAEQNKQNKRHVWPIFYKVNPSDIRHQRNNYGKAMIEHEGRFGKDSEKVLNWRSALAKVAGLKGDHLTGQKYECKFFDQIVQEITRLLPKYLQVGEQVIGLESSIEEVESLLNISSRNTVFMLGIHGSGGIGKTTLAKALYNSIAHQFDYVNFLFDVRETSNSQKGLVSLQEKLLSNMFVKENINSVDEGAYEIRKRLCNKRVLLAFDDVDHEEQLEKLAGECNWFGSGSRIIVTTRNRHLLSAGSVEKIYEMKELNSCEALELFCWKAFKNSQPPKEFLDLSNDVVNYASGLPLALKVIGSNLYGKDLGTCISALEEYKRIPDKSIQRILRISYDGLTYNQQKIFLDIAFFFKWKELKDVKNILHACGFFPEHNIQVLVDKSLITINGDGFIGMHDLIQSMGKEVVREEAPEEPGERSRLCFEEDIVEVLKENSGTHKIQGIILESPQQKIQWKGTAFRKMKNLRILIVKNACFSVGPKYLPNNLRVLEWNQYPWTSLPSKFDLEKLVILQMPASSLKLEISIKKSKCLSVMNFSHCQSIIEIPDISGALALKTLDLSNCKNLVKVHDSIGFLTKVMTLKLANCINLTSLPRTMQMASLEELDINGCTRLEHLPDFWENMNCLSNFYAGDTAIKELPYSIGNLVSLRSLYVSKSNLVSIPESIKKLSNLKHLLVEGCKNLKQLPYSIGDLISLHSLYVSRSNLVSVPESITRLSNLERLLTHECENLQETYELPSHLKRIYPIFKKSSVTTTSTQDAICI